MMAQELIAAKSAELHQIVDEVVTIVSDGVGLIPDRGSNASSLVGGFPANLSW